MSGHTQSSVAKAAGIAQPKISQLENGEIKISLSTMQKIADIIGFPFAPSRLTEYTNASQTPYGKQNN